MISQTVEYALRAVVYLAMDPTTPRTTQQVADHTRVPAGYLSKVLQALGRVGLVQSQRGLHGGFMLARDPETLTILDVVNAVDPIERIRLCPLGIEAHGINLCPLHRKLDDALAGVERAFATCTVADLTRGTRDHSPLCEVVSRRKGAGTE